ncbi:PTS mannitol transporter subunit IICB [Enterococcus sp. PF-2]|uniref:PTS mannitol transporter subunit IICB n=2 Tax=unclassified Enterococcus TaxID=2608891 RepID=UPI00111F534A|nr:PTS mannitol transporter subunit IICB [Enterococcus sp. PF-3]TPE00577.1 PTS mannitol transporter subunit IICB [Enterococcus sp. PF-3]TPE24238.1 PTS mannitol transporter subunit IICB [Enterococcus sp. PF-2]
MNRTNMVSSAGIRVKLQKMGSFLSGMIMPNILAFIAWGLLAALFIPTGWLPNEKFNEIVPPTLNYLLPLLVAYTGGKQVYGTRGAVVASMVTMGLIVGADVTMFLGAMIVGPSAAWGMKKIDSIYEEKVKTGFEMLVKNFSGGIYAAILTVIGYVLVGPIFNTLNYMMTDAVNVLVENHLLPLVSIFMEPAKVLFLNNAINFGVFAPIGLEQVAENGRSMMFAIDNPGVGLGILLSYMVFGKGTAKKTAPGSIVIHFFGGIAEIFFPYVLMNPLLLIPAILGGMSGVATLMITGAGMISPASPGSIFAFMAVTPRGSHFGILLAITVATAVTFIGASLVHKLTNRTSDKNNEEFLLAEEKTKEMKRKGKISKDFSIKKIIFACDAGMGSSAMGAAIVRKKVQELGYDIEVTNVAIRDLSADETSLVITQKELQERAKKAAPSAHFQSVDEFLNSERYDEILADLRQSSSLD